MPTRTTLENNSKAETAVLSPDRTGPQANSNRWRFNGTGQLVDSEAATAEWDFAGDLADEIVRLGIADVGTDAGDDGRGQICTPPPSKMDPAVLQLSETSPLESSDTSADSSHSSDHQVHVSHSRGSSTDTTVSSSQESTLSSASHKLLAPSHTSLSVDTSVEVKERPHSFSGGLSSAELRRLQQAGGPPSGNILPTETADSGQPWPSSHHRENVGSNDRQFTPESQLTYPSLTQHSATVPRQPSQQLLDQTASANPAQPTEAHRDEPPADYHNQLRNFNSLPGHIGHGSSGPSFVNGRPNGAVTGLSYRQAPRAYSQGLLPSPTNLGYPGNHHTAHLSLGNTQQMYDLMMPGPHDTHPAVARVQQQHNVFPRTHQHSASDPSALRDAATLALLANNMQAFPGPGSMFPSSMAPPVPPTMSIYPSQFYPGQDPYPRADVATSQAMAATLQSQYTGPYGAVSGQNMAMDGGIPRPGMPPGPSSPNDNGPSLNNRKLGLYKTELCRSWEEKGSCRYATKCQFAHGEEELRKVARHPKVCFSWVFEKLWQLMHRLILSTRPKFVG
jgi:hypothetical protein